MFVSQQQVPPPLGTQRIAAKVLKDSATKNTKAVIFFISIPLLLWIQETAWQRLGLGLVVYQLRLLS